MSTCVVLFAKKPAPGAVKTRLQSHLSAPEAARLYEALLLDCATALHETKAAAKAWPLPRSMPKTPCAPC